MCVFVCASLHNTRFAAYNNESNCLRELATQTLASSGDGSHAFFWPYPAMTSRAGGCSRAENMSREDAWREQNMVRCVPNSPRHGSSLFVQVKMDSEYLYLYCHKHTFTVESHVFPCTNDVYRFDRGTRILVDEETVSAPRVHTHKMAIAVKGSDLFNRQWLGGRLGNWSAQQGDANDGALNQLDKLVASNKIVVDQLINSWGEFGLPKAKHGMALAWVLVVVAVVVIIVVAVFLGKSFIVPLVMCWIGLGTGGGAVTAARFGLDAVWGLLGRVLAATESRHRHSHDSAARHGEKEEAEVGGGNEEKDGEPAVVATGQEDQFRISCIQKDAKKQIPSNEAIAKAIASAAGVNASSSAEVGEHIEMRLVESSSDLAYKAVVSAKTAEMREFLSQHPNFALKIAGRKTPAVICRPYTGHGGRM
jgi:hypothetical protein